MYFGAQDVFLRLNIIKIILGGSQEIAGACPPVATGYEVVRSDKRKVQ